MEKEPTGKESLEDVRRQFEAIFSNLPIGLTYLSPDMRFIRVNPFMEKKMGLTLEQIKGRHCYDTSGQYRDDPARKGEQRICDTCGVRKALQTGEPYKFIREVNPNFIIENMGVPIKDDEGNILGAVEIIVDITDRVRMQDRLETLVEEKSGELLKSQSLLNNIINSSADAIFTLDGEGRFSFLNAASDTVFGRGIERLLGSSIEEVISASTLGRLKEAIKRLAENGGSPDNLKLSAFGDDGRERRLLLSISPLSGEDEANRFVGVCKDVTRERKLAEEREDFITMVTHDLKTPLTSIVGYTSMLMDLQRDEDSEARTFLDGIKVNAERMLSLTKNFLSAGRIDKHMFVIKPERVGIGSVIIDSMKAMEHQLKEKDISIEAEFPQDLPDVRVDKDYMERVLCNLISNAIKFTPLEGKITIRAYRSADGRVHIQVSDTGVGIPQSELPLLFDKYYQGANKSAGSGLGLFIAKNIVEAHHGEITVESQAGQGTVFTIRLPHD